jgi:ADP-ribose pyrophosphatase YjhB (NUDIX family)
VPIPEFIVELRRHVGDAKLWLPAVTAVIHRGDELLLVRRSDNGIWSPVTGIMDPGEEPAGCAVREAREETGVEIRVDRLAAVTSGIEVTHVNGDRAVYLDLAFACTWVSGEPYVADDESVDVRWWPIDGLPEMKPIFLERIEAALSDETGTRFRSG